MKFLLMMLDKDDKTVLRNRCFAEGMPGAMMPDALLILPSFPPSKARGL